MIVIKRKTVSSERFPDETTFIIERQSDSGTYLGSVELDAGDMRSLREELVRNIMDDRAPEKD